MLVRKRPNAISPESARVPDEQIAELERFANFVVLVYNPLWLTASNVADAPDNDLQLLNKISKYASVDEECSGNDGFRSRHLWYLHEKLVPLCLFSNNLKDNVKDKVAKKTLEAEKEVSNNVQIFLFLFAIDIIVFTQL